MFDGQSLNNIPNSSAGFPSLLMSGRPQAWSNVSINGTSWTGLSTTAASRRDPVLNHTTRAVLVLAGGSADFATEHDSAATAYADLLAYITSARAGFTGSSLKVIGVTVPPSTVITGGDETARVAYNALLLASGAVDAVVNLDADARLQNPADATYYVDGSHWTAPGAVIAAGLFVPALESVLAALV